MKNAPPNRDPADNGYIQDIIYPNYALSFRQIQEIQEIQESKDKRAEHKNRKERGVQSASQERGEDSAAPLLEENVAPPQNLPTKPETSIHTLAEPRHYHWPPSKEREGFWKQALTIWAIIGMLVLVFTAGTQVELVDGKPYFFEEVIPLDKDFCKKIEPPPGDTDRHYLCILDGPL